jgi:hypothetical protein
MIVGLGLVVVTLCIAVAAASALMRKASPSATADLTATASTTNRYGTIVQYHDGQRCEHQMFDNSTGHFSEKTPSCEGYQPVDANGVPMPKGTMNVMNAISKSFH